ncbi:MAG: hypothetical protein U5J99_09465 [Parvularculaceae bacterium]|nr:hypothetical protein [Parvularculaceae bacterium]
MPPQKDAGAAPPGAVPALLLERLDGLDRRLERIEALLGFIGDDAHEAVTKLNRLRLLVKSALK